MKVVLVVPNFRWTGGNKDFLWDYIPYNLCLLGAMIRDIAEVELIDAYKEDLSCEQFFNRLRKSKPDVVGTTVMIDPHLEAGRKVCTMAKMISPSIRTIMGGAASSMNAEDLIKSGYIDIVVKGEGEFAITDAILGINKDNSGIINLPQITDLKVLPPPDYSLIDLPSYISTPPARKSVDSPRAYPYGRIITSRGCPYGCCFCQVESIMGKKWRGRSVESVLGEIAWLKKDYGIRSLVFDDDNLLYDMPRAKSIFKGMIDRGLAMPWSMIATSVIKMDYEMIRLMKKSGCEYVDVAIESGVERVLKEIIRKPIDLHTAMDTVTVLQDEGIFVAANFIIGFPGETWKEIRETIYYAESLGADYTKIFTATPLKNTRLWDMCVSGGHLRPGKDWSQGQIETEEFTPQDLTILRAFEWDRINFSSIDNTKKIAHMMGILPSELNQIRKETRRRAYESLH